MKTVLIRPGLYLNSQVVKPAREKKETTVVTPENLNHMFIIDRSGSMYGLIRDLCKDLVERVNNLPDDDSITLAWFSGQGQYRFVLKGVVLNSPKARKSVIDTINGLASTVGMTCFSEVLEESSNVLSDLKHLSGDFTLFFLTDGNPCVSDYSKEMLDISSALKKLNGKLNYSAFVGYGDYYNKELMDDMAKKVGGSSFHSDNFKMIQDHIVTYIDTARQSAPSVDMKVDDRLNSIPAFHVKGKTITMLEGNNLVKVTPNRWDKSNLYWFSTLPATTALSAPTEDEIKGLYAGAVAASKSDQLDIAIDCLSTLCDYEMMGRLYNAFTQTEVAEVESEINKRVYFSKLRPETLLKPQPVANSIYSFLELIKDLSEDGAEIAISHDKFQYKRIGVGSIVDDGYPKFKKKEDVRVNINSLVWNTSRLNLSISTKIPGTIDLGKNTNGFAETDYPTYIYRSYTLIKDGNKNVLQLPIVLERAKLQKYWDKGLNIKMDGDVAIVDVSTIPLINRAQLPVEFKAESLAELAIIELQYEAKVKALKEFVDPEELAPKQSITQEQIEFLKSKGINHNGFNPPSKALESQDSYSAPTFEIKIKSFSTLPSVNAIKKKIAESKKFTLSEEFLHQHLLHSSKIENPKFELEKAKNTLWKVRTELYSHKFMFLLSKKSFSDIGGRQGSLSKDGFDISFVIENKEFAY